MPNLTAVPLQFFATTPKGLELLLVDELRSLGITTAKEKLAGVEFTADLTQAYKACLWSRLANRILLKLIKFPAASPEELYAGVQSIDWSRHMEAEGTLTVNFSTVQSNITHTLFGAQKVKDAIVDQFREKFDVRPSVAREQPDLSLNLYLYRDVATLSIDLSGDSLHKRGYRLSTGAAPLKENLAAAILIRAGWPAIAKEGGMLLDPMCGSGTLLIEGALMAGDVAPGLLREYFGFAQWKKHDARQWKKLLDEAQSRAEKGILTLPTILGFDADANAIKVAFENIERANMHGLIHVEKRELAALTPKQNAKPGLLIVNPPYGERLGDIEELGALYTQLGDKFKEHFTGWKAGVFTGNPDLGKVMGVRARKFYPLFNGALPCKLLLFDINPEKFIDRSPGANNDRRIRAAQKAVEGLDNHAVQMFANRVKKNLKHLKRHAERAGTTKYRIYDADLPEYAFVIDIENDTLIVREYEPPRSVNLDLALQRQNQVLAILPEVMDMAASQIYFSVIPREPRNYSHEEQS
jgi:23S rRNA (guanine2445-N2)-methyltransferase / 23S rRNA (guanine2069-N7)-methyltransferase